MKPRVFVSIVVAPLIMLLGGCLGPATVRQTRDRYNEAIRQTNNEELLLNLVRLRYNEHPSFLPVTGLNAQFSLTAGAQYRGGPERGALDNFGDGTLGYSDRPTLTFAPQRPPELTRALLTQVSLDTLYLFTRQAGDTERVLRLFVRRMNGIENASSGGGPMPQAPPDFVEFRVVSEMLARLERLGVGVLTTEQRTIDLSDATTIKNVEARDLVEIKKAGYGIRQTGSSFQLTQIRPVRVLALHLGARERPEVLELEQSLGLRPAQASYPVDEAPEGQYLRSIDDQPRERITFTTRSILEVMYLLSKTVAVPEEHYRKAVVRDTRNPDGTTFDWNQVSGDLFHVCVSKHRPASAFVAVKYREFWYYIQDCDLSSKTTMNLFSELLRLQKIGSVEGSPLLSLPLGP